MASPRSADSNRRSASDAYRELPAVSQLLRVTREFEPRLDERVLVALIQDVLARARGRLAANERPDRAQIEHDVRGEVARLTVPRLAPVLNATGVIIHTNLGRAPVSAEAAAAMAGAAANAVALELDPETNQRGGRMDEVSAMMRVLAGAEATLVVNNGAAAVLLVLSAVAAGREVIVSRGEAVEIGGGFRIPDVIGQSGATLVEVGTTNRTYAADYARATTAGTAAYLKVHPSNFTMSGFTYHASTVELSRLGIEHAVPVVEDLGSGALLDTAAYGLAPEPTIGGSLAAGASLVTASGDKLLGGPQAGIICGSAAWVERVERHPLARAVRADKTCLAGLATTLRHYLRGEAAQTVPVWRMIAAPAAEVQARAEQARSALAQLGVVAEIAAVQSSIGGGALPGQDLPSVGLALSGQADELGRRLRLGQPAVFGRVERDRLLLDFRTVLPENDQMLVDAVRSASLP